MTVRLEALPPADAIAALEARGKRLDPSFAWQDVYQEQHAASYTVAKSAGFDILQDLFEGVRDGLATGTGQREFNARVIPLLQEKGWWGRQLVRDPLTGEDVVAQLGSLRRLKTIFDVNMRVSYAAGHWSNFERNKAARPFLRYVCILDDRTRPEHRARHNLCLPVDHPYWNVWAPPCGWSCRCTLQSLSQRDVDRMRAQLRFEPPTDLLRDWLNKRTGEVSRIPEGIDPGWAYNPGKAGAQSAIASASKLIDAPPDLAAAANADPDWIRKPLEREFADWFDQAAAGGPVDRTMVAIGALDAPTLAALADRGITPQSGALTIDQRVVRHAVRDAKAERGRAVPIEILRRLPELLASPRAILRDRRDDALLYIFDAPIGTVGKVVVRMDFSSKTREPGEPPTRIVTNAVRTAGIVEEQNLFDPAYDLIFGVI